MGKKEIKRYDSLEAFWPYYLSQHTNKINKRLHVIGTTLGLFTFIYGFLLLGNPLYILYAMFFGYFFAWVGHFFFQKNKPATFKYPLYSFLSDWKMWYYILSGKMKF